MELNNNELVNSIKEMKETKTDESQIKVITGIRKAKFLCPVIIEDAPVGGGKINITKDSKVQFSIIKANDGKNYLLAFTSEPEIHKWQTTQKQQTLIYTFEDYAHIILNNPLINGFVIDPKGENLVLSEETINAMRNNITKEVEIEKDTEVELGIPANYPEDLVPKLKDCLRNIEECQKAYLMLMKQNGENSGYLLVVDAGKNTKDYFTQISSALAPYLEGMGLSMTIFDSEVGKSVSEHFEPIYIKE